MSLRARIFLAAFFAFLLAGTSILHAHESPVDHFDRVVQIYIDEGKLHLIYKLHPQERQAMFQLQKMDANNDGQISDHERDAYFQAVYARLAQQLTIEIDGKRFQLSAADSVKLSPDLTQTFHMTAPIAALPAGTYKGRFIDDYSRTNPGEFVWRPRQLNKNGIEVDAIDAPVAEKNASHPTMIAIHLKIVVSAPKSPQ